MAIRVVTVNDILDGHVGLDLECFDRIHLKGWVPNLQVPGQVVGFLTRHLGFPILSPAIMEKIWLRFRKEVAEFARDNDIEVIRFAKGEHKLEVMRPYLDRLARRGRTGVAGAYNATMSTSLISEIAVLFRYDPCRTVSNLPLVASLSTPRTRSSSALAFETREADGPAA